MGWCEGKYLCYPPCNQLDKQGHWQENGFQVIPGYAILHYMYIEIIVVGYDTLVHKGLGMIL